MLALIVLVCLTAIQNLGTQANTTFGSARTVSPAPAVRVDGPRYRPTRGGTDRGIPAHRRAETGVHCACCAQIAPRNPNCGPRGVIC